MSWNFTCVEQLEAAIRSYQGSAAARNAFNDGLMSSPLLDALDTFNVSNKERDEYQIEPECDTIITDLPQIQTCGADLVLVPDTGELPTVYFSPFAQALAIDACKTKCDKRTFEQWWAKKERAAGAGFGKRIQNIFWFGMPALGQAGISQINGTRLNDVSQSPKYADLMTASANDIANFFWSLTYNMDDPIIYMGPVTMELIGWRERSTTGDTCSDMWDCTMSRLANRWGLSEEAARNRFRTEVVYDHMTGIDPNNATDEMSVIHVIDRAHVRMGLEDNETRSCVWAEKGSMAYAERAMHLTAPQVLKDGSNRFAFGFIDHQAVLDAEGGRYADCGDGIGITVPTPIV